MGGNESIMVKERSQDVLRALGCMFGRMELFCTRMWRTRKNRFGVGRGQHMPRSKQILQKAYSTS